MGVKQKYQRPHRLKTHTIKIKAATKIKIAITNLRGAATKGSKMIEKNLIQARSTTKSRLELNIKAPFTHNKFQIVSMPREEQQKLSLPMTSLVQIMPLFMGSTKEIDINKTINCIK